MDTNAIIDYISARLPNTGTEFIDEKIDNNISISVINRIEILGFTPSNPNDIIPFQEFAQTVVVHPLSFEIEEETIKIRKQYRIKLPDAIIAATAIVHNLTLISRNEKDFIRIEGINLLNPYNI